MAETGLDFEWRIENLSHWCAEVHVHCIRSPDYNGSLFSHMQLYPKGIDGQGEHLVVHLGDINCSYSGELSFCSSDGSLLCPKQQVNAKKNKNVLELPPGPKFEDVLSRIRESEDFITVTLRVKHVFLCKLYMRTVINGLKISVKINPKGIEDIKSFETRNVCELYFSPNFYSGCPMVLQTCSEYDTVHFMITPPNNFEFTLAVEMCMSWTRSDGTVDRCVKKENVFHDKNPWRFPDPMKKEDLDGKGISLFFCVKTKSVIESPFYINLDNSGVSIEFHNTPCFSTKEATTDPLTSNEFAVLTKDSGSQPSLTSDIPDDSVLSKDLMCLYQDQDFSDITLKCDNVTFPVHRAILSARSPVFKTMLSSDMKEAASGTVDIGDLDPSTLSRFLTYLYTGVVEDLQDDRALKLYYAADKYQVPSLKRDCSKFLCANLSLQNVCDILSLGDRHQDEELTAASHDFILDNFNTVLKSKEWDTLKKNEPLLAVDTVTQFAVEDRVGKNPPQ